MNWAVFSCSVPAKTRSRFRVERRLGRLAAIASASGVYILPARDEGVEAGRAAAGTAGVILYRG